jgi:crotonobetainyl-CoA:carnitine CoA-transferase CaiB-like acyl-CoA transferase
VSADVGGGVGLLDPYRVIDLTDERGLLCGLILGDLGADVIRVEPPGGSPARAVSPGGSLVWEAWARNSRSVAVDVAAPEGQAALRELVASADFVIESAPPGHMAALGLGYDALAAINPALVYVSITPFGQDGPAAGYAATDLIVQAASGMLSAVGDADRPPLVVRGHQAWAHAGAEAAGAALIAHHERVRSGRGQHVDVSAQQAAALAGSFQPLAAAVGSVCPRRASGAIVVGPVAVPTIYAARDGFVSLTLFFGPSQGPFTRRLMDWIYEEGGCDEATRAKDWVAYLQLLFSGAEPLTELDRVIGIVSAFLRQRSVAELFEEAVRRSLMLVPVSSPADVAADRHLADRHYWRPASEETGPDRPLVPGPFAVFSATPIRYRRAAPAPGQHTAEVMSDVRPTTVGPPSADPARPLDDVKVLDFMWVMAGPWATRTLADHGATVVKIESATKIDGLRVLPPFIDGQQDVESSAGFQSVNAGKLSVALNPATPLGKQVVLDLVEWADVVTESFSPKAMRAWGLDYESLLARKPDIIMVSSSLFGQTGPYSPLPGVGIMGSALAGITALTGWPDRNPTGPFGPYTDYVAPRYTVAALLAALDHRRRTGQGQHIDLAQMEASIPFIAPELLDYIVNGASTCRVGNSHPTMSPHGLFPTAGDDRWVAIATRDDDDWRRMAGAMGRPDLARDPELATSDGRRTNESRVDAAVTEWTQARTAAEATALLQSVGVPAYSWVADDLPDDPQLVHRGHLLRLPHSRHGTVIVESTHVGYSRTPARPRWGAPVLGEHTSYALREILGYDEARITALLDEGAVGPMPVR